MPIIINEFEIIPAPPTQPAEAAPVARQERNEEAPLRPEDIERVVERQRQRRLRVWAD